MLYSARALGVLPPLWSRAAKKPRPVLTFSDWVVSTLPYSGTRHAGPDWGWRIHVRSVAWSARRVSAGGSVAGHAAGVRGWRVRVPATQRDQSGRTPGGPGQ